MKNNVGDNDARSAGASPAGDAADKKRGKKRALIILISAVALMLVLLILNNLDWQAITAGTSSIVSGKQTKDFYFWPVNYDADIFLDSQYMDKNRYISYTNGAETTLITDGNYGLYGPAVAILAEYINAAIEGDAEKLNSLFSDEYWKNHDKYDRITMQRIYNAELTQTSDSVISEGQYQGVHRWTFDVRYMIMKNDGTFRSDMESDSSVPLVFEILSDGTNTLINSVSEYNYVVWD